eukprot:14886559-Heterocapsa_arctica.AAC.1
MPRTRLLPWWQVNTAPTSMKRSKVLTEEQAADEEQKRRPQTKSTRMAEATKDTISLFDADMRQASLRSL